MTVADFSVGYNYIPSLTGSKSGHAGADGGYWGCSYTSTIGIPSVSYNEKTGILTVSNISVSLSSATTPTMKKEYLNVILLNP